MTTPNPKFDMSRENQDLKIFFFTVQSGPVNVEFPEDFKAIMAYNDQGAVDSLRKDYLGGAVLTVRKRGEVPIRKIVDAVNLQVTSSPQELKINVMPSPTREKTERDFVLGMMLVADKFVHNVRDRASIKRILGKIKLKEDPVDTTIKN